MIGTNSPIIKDVAECLEVRATRKPGITPESDLVYYDYEKIFAAMIKRIEYLEERVTNMELGI